MLDLDDQVAVCISAIVEKALVKPGRIKGYLVLPWRTIKPLE